MSAPLSHLRIPLAALALATTDAEICALVRLYRLADEARWAPFKLSTRQFRGDSLSGGRAAALLAAMEEDGLIGVVDRGGRHDRMQIVVRNPTSGDFTGWCSRGAELEHNPEHNPEHQNTQPDDIVDDSGAQPGAQPGAPTRARGSASNLQGSDPSNVDRSPDIVEQGSTPDPDPAEPEQQGQPNEPKALHWTADLWAQLQAVRREHEPTVRGQGLTPKRKANLQTRCKELRQAGLSRDDLLRAARWVHESANIRAEGARTTGDPLAVLLRPAHCVEYCELAEAEEREAATQPDRREGERREGDERRSEPRPAMGQSRAPAGSRALADLARRMEARDAAKASEATQTPALRLVEA